MATVLLAWNPRKSPWDNLQEELARVRRGERPEDAWSVGNSDQIHPGDRFFIIRLGEEPRGLVGSGWVTSRPFEDTHWNPEEAAGATARFVHIVFERLESHPIMSWAELHQQPFASFRWGIQMSGVRIPDEVADPLEELWTQRSPRDGIFSGEAATRSDFREGAATRVYVNRYERDPKARAACISVLGSRCSCCGISMEEKYGPVAADLIHVHHLEPLGEVRSERQIDPVRDLRPVCPSCHTVIHLRKPPFRIEEVRQFLQRGHGA
jgi:5-methylcytosine-specific restriction enzyme A